MSTIDLSDKLDMGVDELTAAKFKNDKSACTCASIQAADPGRHFRGCPERVEVEDLKVTIGGVEIKRGDGVDGAVQSFAGHTSSTYCAGCVGRIDVGDECVMLGGKAYCPMCACARPELADSPLKKEAP
jgi:hypothetical protein